MNVKLIFLYLLWLFLITLSSITSAGNFGSTKNTIDNLGDSCVLPKEDFFEIMGGFTTLLQSEVAKLTRVMLNELDKNIEELNTRYTKLQVKVLSKFETNHILLKVVGGGHEPSHPADILTNLLDAARSRMGEPRDCLDILSNGETVSSVYTIFPRVHNTGIKVFCDMETDGGGWTVFLSRQKQNKQEDFDRDWLQYKNGFGDPAKEYWLGNEILYLLTSHTGTVYTMRAEIEAKTEKSWGEWKYFEVKSEYRNYTLTIVGYNTNSDMPNLSSFGYNNGLQFTTKDRKNDFSTTENCASYSYGGFWYSGAAESFICSHVHATRNYGRINVDNWHKKPRSERADKLVLMIRPSIETC